VQIFKQEKASAEKDMEILQLKWQPQETCRMLKARMKHLLRETGLLNELEHCWLDKLNIAMVLPIL
jgi:hypothetical protein